MQLSAVTVVKPETTNFILGQSHFIKTVEDIHETLAGTDDALVEMASQNALNVAAGHSFFVFLGDGFFPVNVLNALKAVPEVCRIFCATANPVEVLVAQTDQGRGIVGVIDGFSPLGV